MSPLPSLSTRGADHPPRVDASNVIWVLKLIAASRNWFHNAASSSMLSQLDALTSAYGSMEVIRLVPIPVAHL